MRDETTFYNEATTSLDMGLRKYMQSVFSYMSAGLGLTAIVAYFFSTSATLMTMMFSSPGIALLFALIPFGIVIYLSTQIARISPERARTLFFAYAACLGLSLAPIFAVYTGASVAKAFFVSASMFLSMVIYGYTTDRDLTNFGAFLFMGLIGLIVASLVNLFLRSSAMDFIVSVVGVVIFTGLTAFDAQKIKNYYMESEASDLREKKAIFGALMLYLDFINLFLYVLRFLGNRNR